MALLTIGYSLAVFASIFASALLAFLCRTRLGEQHLSPASLDAMKQVISLVATRCALVLGLMLASAKGSFDNRNTTLNRIATDIIQLDRLMATYGPEAREVRGLLRSSLKSTIARVWPDNADPRMKVGNAESEVGLEGIQQRLFALSPTTEAQKRLQGSALTILEDIMRVRWLALGQSEHGIPLPFLVVLVFWLSLVFFGFNLFIPNSKVVAATMFAGALGVSSAIFLILEMDSPFSGLMRLSPVSLRNALATLGPLP